jgi:hypothetical protein
VNTASYISVGRNDHIYVTQTAKDGDSHLWVGADVRLSVRHDRSGLAWVAAMRDRLFSIEQRIEAQLKAESDAAEARAAREVNCAQAEVNAQDFGTLSPASTSVSRINVTRGICEHDACQGEDDGGEAA